jgi:hypothetical protein
VITARLVAAVLFLATVVFLAHTHRRLRDRARAEEADGLLREAFDHLERSAPPPGDRASGDG